MVCRSSRIVEGANADIWRGAAANNPPMAARKIADNAVLIVVEFSICSADRNEVYVYVCCGACAAVIVVALFVCELLASGDSAAAATSFASRLVGVDVCVVDLSCVWIVVVVVVAVSIGRWIGIFLLRFWRVMEWIFDSIDFFFIVKVRERGG